MRFVIVLVMAAAFFATSMSGPSHATEGTRADTVVTKSASSPSKPSPTDGNPQGIKPKGPRILVFPYQSIFRSTDISKGRTATKLLVEQLKSTNQFTVLRGGTAVENTAQEPRQSRFEELNKAAEEAERSKMIKTAIKARREAISELENHPETINRAHLYIMSHHKLARALMWSGADMKAEQVMRTAAVMAPNLDLPAAEFSRFYRKRFAAAREEAIQAQPANLLVRTALPGAKVSLDGHEAIGSPVNFEALTPGKHLLQATLDGVSPSAQIIHIQPREDLEVTLSFGETVGGVAVGAVSDAIAENSLPAAAVMHAVRAGRLTKAKYVIVGGIAQDVVGAKLNVHTFVIEVSSGGVQRLALTTYDLDMLTAQSDVLSVARAVENSIQDFVDAHNTIPSIDEGVETRSTINVVQASPKGPQRTVQRQPIRRPIRAPGGSGTLKIKD